MKGGGIEREIQKLRGTKKNGGEKWGFRMIVSERETYRQGREGSKREVNENIEGQ